MAYSFAEIRKFAGLFLQQNSFEVPDGAMEIAKNVTLKSDSIISKTQGFYKYWEPAELDPLTDIRSLVLYDEKLIGIFFDGVGHFLDSFPNPEPYDAVGVLTENTGGVSIVGEQPSRFAEANLNLYFTTTTGVFKLESYDAPVRRTGVPDGLDIGLFRLNETSSGVLPANSQTAYRVVFGRRDSNGNLNLGVPSDILVITIPASGAGASYNRSGGGPYTVTVVAPGNGMYIGQQIFISNGSDPDVDGNQTVTYADDDLFEFSIVADPGASGTLNYTADRSPVLEISVADQMNTPSTDQYFAQIYRSSSSAGINVTPNQDFRLISEVNLSSSDLSLGVIFFTDDIDVDLGGAELYTNPNTGEGELQANARPPLAKDLCLFKGYLLYANTISRQVLALTVASNNPSGFPWTVSFKYGVITEVYVAVTGAGNTAYQASSVSGTGTITITTPINHNFSTGYNVLIANVTGTLPPGIYPITVTGPNTFTVSSPGKSATALTFEGVNNGTNGIFSFTNSSGSVANDIDLNTRALVKSINRNSLNIYANYVSGVEQIPGSFTVKSYDFIDPIFVSSSLASVPPSGGMFVEDVPLSFVSGRQIYSNNDVLQNALFISKLSEPEAVPTINFLMVGSKRFPIIQLFALRDSVIIIKQDGIFRLTGEVSSQFAIAEMDTTVLGLILPLTSATKINNTVVAFTNQGIVEITDNSVQIISRTIEDVIQPLVGKDIYPTCLWGYETQRLVYISTLGINTGDPPVTYLYNVLNQKWTSSDFFLSHMALGPEDVMYGIQGNNPLNPEFSSVYRQRNSGKQVDFSGDYAVCNFTSDSGQRTGVLDRTSGPATTVEVGDSFLYQDVFSPITSVTQLGPNSWQVGLGSLTSIAENSTEVVTLYKAIESKVKMAPFHAGEVGREKHFAQMSITTRQNQLLTLTLEFSNSYFGGSSIIDWSAMNISNFSGGWGNVPWGFFPWGLESGINTLVGTQPAPIVRTYIPRFAARAPYIQPIITHKVAALSMVIQAISFQIRGYGERVSR